MRKNSLLIINIFLYTYIYGDGGCLDYGFDHGEELYGVAACNYDPSETKACPDENNDGFPDCCNYPDCAGECNGGQSGSAIVD